MFYGKIIANQFGLVGSSDPLKQMKSNLIVLERWLLKKIFLAASSTSVSFSTAIMCCIIRTFTLLTSSATRHWIKSGIHCWELSCISLTIRSSLTARELTSVSKLFNRGFSMPCSDTILLRDNVTDLVIGLFKELKPSRIVCFCFPIIVDN